MPRVRLDVRPRPARPQPSLHRGGEGRYALGPEGGCWFLSIPTRTAAAELREIGLLCDPGLRIATDGEVLVSCDPDDLLIGAFPARVEQLRHEGHLAPTFRREVAEVLVAWCNSRHRAEPDHYPQAYLDDDTLVHVHQHLRALDGYTPWRIALAPGGHYRIDGDEWTFHLAPTPRLPSHPRLCPPTPGRKPRG